MENTDNTDTLILNIEMGQPTAASPDYYSELLLLSFLSDISKGDKKDNNKLNNKDKEDNNNNFTSALKNNNNNRGAKLYSCYKLITLSLKKYICMTRAVTNI